LSIDEFATPKKNGGGSATDSSQHVTKMTIDTTSAQRKDNSADLGRLG